MAAGFLGIYLVMVIETVGSWLGKGRQLPPADWTTFTKLSVYRKKSSIVIDLEIFVLYDFHRNDPVPR